MAKALFECLGKDLVRVAGFWVTAGGIVDHDDGPTVEYQGPLDHFPWVNAGAIKHATKQLLKGQYTMLGGRQTLRAPGLAARFAAALRPLWY